MIQHARYIIPRDCSRCGEDQEGVPKILKKGNIYKLVKLHISISTHRICGELGKTIGFVRLILFLLQLEGWSGFSVFQTSEQKARTEAGDPTPLLISFPAPLSLSVTIMLQAHLLTHRASLLFITVSPILALFSSLTSLCQMLFFL